MPAVIDTPELMDIEQIKTYDLTHDLTIERPLARPARPGFWRTLAHRITTSLTPTRRERHAPVCRVSRPFETPMDQFVRERPSVALYALTII